MGGSLSRKNEGAIFSSCSLSRPKRPREGFSNWHLAFGRGDVALENRGIDAERSDVNRAGITRAYAAVNNVHIIARSEILGVNCRAAARGRDLALSNVHVRAGTKKKANREGNQNFISVNSVCCPGALVRADKSQSFLTQLSCRLLKKLRPRYSSRLNVMRFELAIERVRFTSTRRTYSAIALVRRRKVSDSWPTIRTKKINLRDHAVHPRETNMVRLPGAAPIAEFVFHNRSGIKGRHIVQGTLIRQRSCPVKSQDTR